MWSKIHLRHVALGVTFAILISPVSVLVLCFGLTGSSGNSLVTGALLATTTLAVGLLCFRCDLVFQPADCLFLALLLCIVSSFIVNGWTSNTKEYELLVLSLAAYPACRFISRADVVSGGSSFTWTASIIVLLGAIVTATALFEQWDDPHGKPIVFGFDAAATHFQGLFSFLIIALVTTRELTVRRTALVSALIFLPTAIFAASMVRFTFIALAGSLCLAIILAEAKQRRHVVGVALVVLIAIATGSIARSSSNAGKIIANYVIKESTGNAEFAKRESAGDVELVKGESTHDVELVNRESTHDVELVKLPSCYLAVDLDNSIAIRKTILRDALVLIPSAGWIGRGLDSFMKLSCIKQTEVHSSILQAAVEFGWLGALLLFLLIVLAGSSILVAARHDGTSRFVLCSLAFIVLMSLASGRVSRDAVLFAFLGCAVGLKETRAADLQKTKTVIGFVSVYYLVKLAVWGACASLVYFGMSRLYHAMDLTSFR
jgi:O-Antigen ligase